MNTLQNYLRIPPISLRESASMLEASQIMSNRSIRHLLILDMNGKLKGILSDRDIQRSIEQTQVSKLEQVQSITSDKLVSDYMTWPVCTVSATTSLDQAARIMLEQRISSVVILDRADHPVGIVTTDDILHAFVHERTRTLAKQKGRFLAYFSGDEY